MLLLIFNTVPDLLAVKSYTELHLSKDAEIDELRMVKLCLGFKIYLGK